MFYVENNKAIQNENTHLLSGQVFQFKIIFEPLKDLGTLLLLLLLRRCRSSFSEFMSV